MKINPVLIAYGAAGLAALYVVSRVAKAVPGIVSGDNALTRGATNAAGDKTTAYEGAGLLGTLGAGFNMASAGTFATLGESLGGWMADKFNGKAAEANAAMNAAATARPKPPPVEATIADRWDAYARGGQRSATGSGSADPWTAWQDATGNGTGYPVDYLGP